MPHDLNDKLLMEGDEVVIRAKVKSVTPDAQYCNVTVETAHPMPPYTTPTTIVLNTKQVEKVV
jgi:hypothetical protein